MRWCSLAEQRHGATCPCLGANCRNPSSDGVLAGVKSRPVGDHEQSPIDVNGKHVVIIGGGDTGADCLGTAHRQGAASVTQLEIMPQTARRAEQ